MQLEVLNPRPGLTSLFALVYHFLRTVSSHLNILVSVLALWDNKELLYYLLQ